MRPLKIVDSRQLLPDAEITRSWQILHEKYLIGSQYDYLARFARQLDLQLEIGLEYSNQSKAASALCGEAELQLCQSGEYAVHRLDPEQSSPEICHLFGNLLIPATTWKMTKLQEIEKMQALGFGHSVTKTWFCHGPILGMLPCGHCNPCKDCREAGLASRLSLAGHLLGSCKQLFHLLMGHKRRKRHRQHNRH